MSYCFDDSHLEGIQNPNDLYQECTNKIIMIKSLFIQNNDLNTLQHRRFLNRTFKQRFIAGHLMKAYNIIKYRKDQDLIEIYKQIMNSKVIKKQGVYHFKDKEKIDKLLMKFETVYSMTN